MKYFMTGVILFILCVVGCNLSYSPTPSSVSVRGYTRSDGTRVRSYNRRPSGSKSWDAKRRRESAPIRVFLLFGFFGGLYGLIKWSEWDDGSYSRKCKQDEEKRLKLIKDIDDNSKLLMSACERDVKRAIKWFRVHLPDKIDLQKSVDKLEQILKQKKVKARKKAFKEFLICEHMLYLYFLMMMCLCIIIYAECTPTPTSTHTKVDHYSNLFKYEDLAPIKLNYLEKDVD